MGRTWKEKKGWEDEEEIGISSHEKPQEIVTAFLKKLDRHASESLGGNQKKFSTIKLPANFLK